MLTAFFEIIFAVIIVILLAKIASDIGKPAVISNKRLLAIVDAINFARKEKLKRRNGTERTR